MPIPPLSKIEITDADIDEIEASFGDIIFDEQRRNIIKHMDSVDIQAFPGSGKTTVLVAKLAILAKKWPYQNKGICVLSHTNVARNEIETRMGSTPIGKALLSYPHFIGTVHSFFDTYVGLPWLRSNGYPITMIDTDIVLTKRWNSLKYGTKKYFESKGLNEYACEAKSFPISIDIGCKDTAPSYNDVLGVVNKSFEAGYFTFNEMLFIAKYAIDSCSYLSDAIQNRFPILFIDEAQDTAAMQWGLVFSSFPNSALFVRQSFGDANQAIFHSYLSKESNESFPSPEYMTISNSHRFGCNIANLIDPLGVKVHGLSGDLKKYDCLNGKHSIFLYDDTDTVLPAYAEYLLSSFSDEELNGSLQCYAVGMVHNKESVETNDPKYPVGIRDYWPMYDPEILSHTPKVRFFIDYFRQGKELFEQSGDYYQLIESIAEGIRRYLRTQKTITISNAGSAFNALLRIIPDSQKAAFRSDLHNMVSCPIDCEDSWNIAAAHATEIFETHFGIRCSVNDYFSWHSEGAEPCEGNEAVSQKNVFSYQSPVTNRQVQIHLASIHSEKGRTHLSTLVLDTYWYERNIKSLIPWLSNTSKKKLGVRDLTRLKCHYVALSRARGLICIAALKKSVSEKDKQLLSGAGWNIIEI